MRASRRFGVAAMVVLVLLVPVAVGSAPAAQAGTACKVHEDPIYICSETFNDSNGAILAARTWCLPGGHSGSSSSQAARCDDPGRDFDWLYPGEHTTPHQDWDIFRVPAGWCVKVTFRYPSPKDDKTNWYNRIGRGATWVKVRDGVPAHVRAQSWTRCP